MEQRSHASGIVRFYEDEVEYTHIPEYVGVRVNAAMETLKQIQAMSEMLEEFAYETYESARQQHSGFAKKEMDKLADRVVNCTGAIIFMSSEMAEKLRGEALDPQYLERMRAFEETEC